MEIENLTDGDQDQDQDQDQDKDKDKDKDLVDREGRPVREGNGPDTADGDLPLQEQAEHQRAVEPGAAQPAAEPPRAGLPDPFASLNSIGTALQAMEELKLLQGAVEADPKGVQQSLQLNGVERAYSTPELVGMVQELMGKVLPGLLEDLEELLESVALRYGTSKVPVTRPPKVELMLAQSTHTPTNCDVPPCFELSRENMVNLYGTPMDVVEKRMSNREYMSRFRLNTKFASALLPSYDHTTATPTIYGALERLLLADITVCTVDGRAFPVVYELARTIKNDWLHHRFTAGWAEVVRQLGIEIGDMLVFERWTEDRTILTMTILKQHSVDQENPDPTWKPMTSAEKKGQF